MLGCAPPSDFVQEIKKEILSYDGILGVHDLIVHNYGAEKKLVSLHAEVSAYGDILKIHDVIDTIERDMKQKFLCDMVIHMDPIDIEDKQTKQLYHQTKYIVKTTNPSFKIHDFRVIKSVGEVKLFFDIAVPFSYQKTEQEIIEQIKNKIEQLGENYIVTITIDHISM